VSDSYAWKGDSALKEEILADLNEDLARERYVQGQYLSEASDSDRAFYGCHVGCLMMAKARYDNRRSQHPIDLYYLAGDRDDRASTWHGEVPAELGMPGAIAHFWDRFFEKIAPELAPHFAVRSLECVPVGADLRLVLPKLVAWMLTDPAEGFLAGAADPQTSGENQVNGYMETVGALWQARAERLDIHPAYGLEREDVDPLQEGLHNAARGVIHDVRSPYHWAAAALPVAGSPQASYSVAEDVAGEYATAMEVQAITFPATTDPFDDEAVGAGNGLWVVAEKFFALCAAAPQGTPR
jgi:hypothetical protein